MEKIKCTSCLGTGYSETMHDHENLDSCSDCNGTGFIVCVFCGGSGRDYSSGKLYGEPCGYIDCQDGFLITSNSEVKTNIEQLEIKNSEIHGLGVFATEILDPGMKFTCNVIVIPKQQIPKVLEMYQYPWDRKNSSICLGFGNFLNHQKDNNLKILSIDKSQLTMTFIVTKQISIGSELFINYHPNAENYF